MNSTNTTYQLDFKGQKILFLTLTVFFVSGAILMFTLSNTEIFLLLNGDFGKWTDLFFKFATYLGDGIFYALIIIILLFVRFGYALDFGLSAAISSIFVQSGKRLFFADAKRPLAALGEDIVHIVQGVDIHMARSFPSGHSTSAMLIFFFLALVAKNKFVKTSMLLLAFIGGYSRIYLSQHFFRDVYAGFAIAVISVLIIALIRNKIGEPLWYTRYIKF